MSELVKKTVEEWLREVDYSGDKMYVPSEFALEFINFIKMVNGEKGEENASPVMHFEWLDDLCNKKQDCINMVFRGGAKSSIMAEYLFLYIAVFGSIPEFGEIDYALYVSDSIDNGVKKMRLRIERRRANSPFLMEYLPIAKINDTRWYFKNKFGKEFVVTGHGVLTGVRGTVELNVRPQLALLDDLISDKDARSQTVIDGVNDIVYSAIDNAMHPKRRKVIWCGTPFNAKDPLYMAVETGAWYVNVFPVCEKFPCTREEFQGGWDDRFDYDIVKARYNKALLSGKVNSFNQELMLRIMSEEERLIEDGDISWYTYRSVAKNRGAYNFYITTDFATSDKQHADFSVINVWGLNSLGEWFWVDGKCKQMLMDESMGHLFRLAQKWQPQGVGIEVTGQQGGFIQWIKQLMLDRNIMFSLACPLGSNKPGLRPTKDKMSRFQTNAVPLFKMGKMHFPEELRDSSELREILEEIRLATIKGFKSRHDDQCFTADTAVWIDTGTRKIGSMLGGDKVVTFGSDTLTMLGELPIMTGHKEVCDYEMSDGSIVSMTDNHPVLTESGWVKAIDLKVSTLIVKADRCKLKDLIGSGLRIKRHGITKHPQTLQEKVNGYINLFGKKSMVLSQKDSLSTISTRIKITTKQIILNCCRCLNIPFFMASEGVSKQQENTLRKSDQWLPSGTSLQKEEGGTKRTTKTLKKNFTKRLTGSVQSVALMFARILKTGDVSVAHYAASGLPRATSRDTKNSHVSGVEKSLDGTGGRDVVVGSTPTFSLCRRTRRRIEKVYNFEVPGSHNYIVGSGMIVHNCDTISMLGEMNVWRPSQEAPDLEEEDGLGGGQFSRYFTVDDDDGGGGDDSYFV